MYSSDYGNGAALLRSRSQLEAPEKEHELEVYLDFLAAKAESMAEAYWTKKGLITAW